jgi:chaperonin GroES
MKFLVAILNLIALEAVLGFTSLASKPVAFRPSTQCYATTLDGRKISGEVKPLNNFLLVKVAEAVEKTEGGILLTGKAKIQKTEGLVVSVGPGKTHQDSGTVFDMPVTVGEGIVYGKYDGTEININGARHTLIRDEDILVKFTGELTVDTVDVVRDGVLVAVDRSEEETEGGILIAKTSKADSKPSTGQVIKVGPGKMASDGELMSMDVAVGDMVKFRDFAGNEVEISEKEYSVVKMSDILAKF